MTVRNAVRRSAVTLITCVLAAASVAQPGHAQKKPITLKDAFTNRDLSSARPGALKWMADGRSNSTLKRNEAGLHIVRTDAATGTESVIVTLSSLKRPGSDAPLSVQGYEWSEDGRWIVLTLSLQQIWRHSTTGDYALYDTKNSALVTLPEHASGIRNVKVSPDGAWVGYVFEDNLFVYNLATREEKQLTFDTADAVYNGRFGWVYEEEFSIVDGWHWSPDSKRIAFWREDERNVPIYTMTDFEPLHLDLIPIRYPKPGDANPIEQIGVVDVAGGTTTWMDLGADTDIYIPRIAWTRDPQTLIIARLNRLQNHLELLRADARTGRTQVILEERSSTGWIEMEDDEWIRFLSDGRRFLWLSERDGWKHAYVGELNGRGMKQVTRGAWEVTEIAGLSPDETWMYYVSTEASPLERQLYRIRLDGSKKERLTKEAGYHTISMSPTCERYLDSWSSLDTPPVSRISDGSGAMLRELTRTDPAKYAAYAWMPREIGSFTTSDGLLLYYSMIKPPNFDPSKKYPVYFDVYGGPGYQNVVNRWPQAVHQWVANEGFIVVQIDNRGGGARGTDFKHRVYKTLGTWEAHDYKACAEHLATMPFVDAARMGIWGWSYGGYMAALTMLLGSGQFAAGVAIAPVTDWRFYDTIYTERYMQRPSDNTAGYDAGSCLTHAEKLKGRLLLIHGAMDDNVHLQNLLLFSDKLNEAGRQYDMRVYPKGNHGVVGSMTSRVAMYEYWMGFLKQTLGVK